MLNSYKCHKQQLSSCITAIPLLISSYQSMGGEMVKKSLADNMFNIGVN